MLRHHHRGAAFCQIFTKGALVELADNGAFQFVAFIEEGEAEGLGDVSAKDAGIFGPVHDGSR